MRQAAADTLAVQEIAQVMLGNLVVPEPDFCAVYAEGDLRVERVLRLANLVLNLVCETHKVRGLGK